MRIVRVGEFGDAVGHAELVGELADRKLPSSYAWT